MSLYDLIFYFFVYGIAGWCTEVVFAAFKQKAFINRGFLNGSICPIYGVSVVIVIGFLDKFADQPALMFVTSIVLVTLLEGVTGFLLEKLFHHRWWDYSDNFCNIHGYVCPLFSLIWGVACTMVVLFVQPLVVRAVALIPTVFGIAEAKVCGESANCECFSEDELTFV